MIIFVIFIFGFKVTPPLDSIPSSTGWHPHSAKFAFLVPNLDPTLYNPLENSPIHPIQGSITYVQYARSPTEREPYGGRAGFEVEVAYIELLEMFEEQQDIVRM